jgi:hypothetical protein
MLERLAALRSSRHLKHRQSHGQIPVKSAAVHFVVSEDSVTGPSKLDSSSSPETCFSSVVVAADGWINLPNLVPDLANPQGGNSMVNTSRAALACSSCRVVIIGIPRVQRYCLA